MPTTRQLPLHENLIEGVDTTLPAHLIGNKWRTQHNMRLTPALQQVPHKVLYSTTGTEDIRWIGVIPGGLYGYGSPRFFTPTKVYDGFGSAVVTGLVDDGNWRRWATAIYDGKIFYSNDLNPVTFLNDSSNTQLTDAPQARYICVWYDHIVAANVTYRQSYTPDRLMVSDLYNFNTWYPDLTNEADFYDFVEWQQTDYPLNGITGIGKLRGTLYVYTPTAIIPCRYVGKPKVINVVEDGIIQRMGNGFPWTLVCLDTIHMFYDGIERSFFAFDGQQVIPIGEPIRQFLNNNLTTDPILSRKMYGFIDNDNREVWWPFVSQTSGAGAGTFDLAVVFNYRYKRWYTASVENVQSFGGVVTVSGTVAQLPGTVAGLTGTVSQLGGGASASPRLFGSDSGKVYREELPTDATNTLITQANPILETGDLIYGDIQLYKENDVMVLNANFGAESASPTIQVKSKGFDFLGDGDSINWSSEAVAGQWTTTQQDAWLNYTARRGRVLRYQFTLLNSRRALFSAFSDKVYAHGAEK